MMGQMLSSEWPESEELGREISPKLSFWGTHLRTQTPPTKGSTVLLVPQSGDQPSTLAALETLKI